MKNLRMVVAGVLTIAAIGVAGATLPSSAAEQPAFQASFDTPGDFFDRFDYGVSGQSTWMWPDGIKSFHGDHDMNCGGPTTGRTVNILGGVLGADTSQAFWYCAPGGDPAKGHVMTGWNTVGYNHVWFAPKGYFTGVSKVCWDINETTLSRRKWTEVQFVDAADATKYPAGQPLKIGTITVGETRGSGGFDLGYTNPGFRPDTGQQNNMLVPGSGTLSGVTVIQGAPSWFQNDQFTTEYSDFYKLPTITDKAARYTQCVENAGPNLVRFTQDTPSGVRTFNLEGQIPQGQVRVVFHDANYDPPKDAPPNPGGTYNAENLTWHWDNIEVFADSGAPQPTTTTSQVATSSSQPGSTTTQPSTTTSTTTSSIPSTTTSNPVTTTTSTVPASTTTTLAPIPACPTSFNTAERTWCQRVMQHIAALEAKTAGG